jgi:hypothetical protein
MADVNPTRICCRDADFCVALSLKDRDRASQPGIHGTKYFTHAAGSQRAFDLVRA